MQPVPPQPRKETIATVTAVTMISRGLYGVRVRLANGTVHTIAIPHGLVTVDTVLLSAQAVMQITAIENGAA